MRYMESTVLRFGVKVLPVHGIIMSKFTGRL